MLVEFELFSVECLKECVDSFVSVVDDDFGEPSVDGCTCAWLQVGVIGWGGVVEPEAVGGEVAYS